VAYFSAKKNTLLKHHLHHASHHDHTIKTPQPNTHFSQNTPQKPNNNNKSPTPTTPDFFSQNAIFREEL
jgi:hypothetical protein